MFRLDGKTALVTGASGGIGSAIAKTLHAQAPKLFCLARVKPLSASWRKNWGKGRFMPLPT